MANLDMAIQLLCRGFWEHLHWDWSLSYLDKDIVMHLALLITIGFSLGPILATRCFFNFDHPTVHGR
jgi:hypothetical protein